MEPEEIISRTDGITDDHLVWEIQRREVERLKSRVAVKFRVVDPQGTGPNVNGHLHTFDTRGQAEQAIPDLLVGLNRSGANRDPRSIMLKIEQVYVLAPVSRSNTQVA